MSYKGKDSSYFENLIESISYQSVQDLNNINIRLSNVTNILLIDVTQAKDSYGEKESESYYRKNSSYFWTQYKKSQYFMSEAVSPLNFNKYFVVDRAYSKSEKESILKDFGIIAPATPSMFK